jgi:NitT/TauT family transport system substrate-binding protein
MMRLASTPSAGKPGRRVLEGGCLALARQHRFRARRPLLWPVYLVASLLLLSCAGSAPLTPQAAPAPAASSGSAGSSAAAPSQPAAAPVAPRPPQTVRVAHAGSFTAWKLADERGYMQEEGIVLDEVVFDTSPRMLPALVAGQVDTATGGIAAGLFNAMAQGIPVRIVLDVWTAAPGNQAGGLYLRKDLVDDGQVRTMSDLRGRRIGITSFGHATELALHRGLQQVGLSIDDVEPVELSYPDMNVAMANRNIDGGITIEPFGTQAIGRGIGARFKPWPELIPNDTVAMFLFSQDFVEKQTDAARRFSKAYVRGLRDHYEAATAGKDRAWINEMIAKHTTLKDMAVVEQMPMTAVNPDGYVNREIISAAQDWFLERGYVNRKVDLDQIIDTQFADYAVAQLGPYRR